MAEAIVVDLTFGILGHLGSSAYKETTQLWGLDTNLEKLEETLFTIQGVLYDAESKACHSEGVKIWLNRLQDAIYDADDILDEFRTEARAAMRRHSKGTNTKAKLCLFFAGSKQLLLRLKISRQIQKIRETIDEIKADSIFVTFGISARENPVPISHLRETHSYVRIEEVIGRELDKNFLTKLLLEYDEKFSVLPIVGSGGIGKTTLAQYVFNDKEVQKHFELKLWVCVSDVFDLKIIIENILLSASGYSQDSKEYITYVEKLKLLNLEQLQIKLRGKLENKRYLLVLDDLWNDRRNKWLELELLLKDGAKGSIVMVTTRSMLVSQITSTTSPSPYELKALGVDQSWSLFQQVAFKPGQEDMISPRIFEIGKEIALKCRGVPLALKTIGSLMYSKPHDQWFSFKDRELANIAQGEDAIMQTLKLSYDHLPAHLKHCFAYCSLYPKDYEIHVPDMVKLWVAQGFVQSSNETDFLEYIGYEYYEALVGRYFFKQVAKNTRTSIWSCTLHDLMHDLATQVSGRNSILLNDKNAADCHRKLRHVSLDFHKLNLSSKFSQMLLHAEKVRSFIQLEELQFASAKDLKWSNLDVFFSNMKRLRVLKLQRLDLEKLPSSLGNLIHLRYLGLRRSSIKKLPRSISRLQNLETLDLHRCIHLSEYPSDLNKFMNLKFIYNFLVPAFLPRGFEELTSLQFLDCFYMANNNSRNAAGLVELKNLNNLGRWLAIRNIGHGTEAATECQAANLKDKPHIKNLELHWKDLEAVEEDMIRNHENSLEGLQPHQNLKILIIFSYNGKGLPRWLHTLTNLTQLELKNCRTCKYVPSVLHQLPCLAILLFSCAYSLEYVFFREEFLSSTPYPFFPSLNELWISFCSSFKGWVRSNINSDGLEYPIIDDQAILWPAFPSLSFLSLEGYLDGVFFPPFPSLEHLRFVSTSYCQLEKTIKMMSEHASLTSTFQTLFIENILGLLLLPEEICNFCSLCSIEIRGCHNLKSWPQGIKNLSSLGILQLEDCPKLATIPEGLVNLSCLRKLKIINCHLLSHRYNRDTGEHWSKISHIPDVVIH